MEAWCAGRFRTKLANFALFCGLVSITVAGILFAPIAHRLLHKVHLETEEKKEL
jgi:hypothetical protein